MKATITDTDQRVYVDGMFKQPIITVRKEGDQALVTIRICPDCGCGIVEYPVRSTESRWFLCLSGGFFATELSDLEQEIIRTEEAEFWREVEEKGMTFIEPADRWSKAGRRESRKAGMNYDRTVGVSGEGV